jgi:extracellular factor (EF) 3-hydroxypalmitic acid methyl ester biosynthesis protein
MRQLTSVLDEWCDRIHRGDGAEAVSALCDHLQALRPAVSSNEWTTQVIPVCRAHPIHELLLEDPYTGRAFQKPRGYAGDAEMLDYVYTAIPPLGTSDVGCAVFRGTTGLPNGRSVVNRRDLLTERIDQVAGSRPNPRILSIACGHLREAQYSRAVISGAVGEFIALDQDAQSLEIVRREQSSFGVRSLKGSVTSIVRRQIVFTNLDLVYAAGLFDYLSEEFSRRLLTLMIGMLRQGGQLLVANFTPDNHGRGYMECFMDWLLTCRDEGQMQSLLKDVATSRIAKRTVYRDSGRNIVYLELTKG